MPLNITPDEAATRFGKLTDQRGVYSHFTDPDTEGVWRPLFNGSELIGYRLYAPPRPMKKVAFRPTRTVNGRLVKR